MGEPLLMVVALAVVAVVLWLQLAADADVKEARAENEALRGIVRQMQEGYEPSPEDGGWWRVFYSVGNPPEREGHPFTDAEARIFQEIKEAHSG